MIGIHDGLPFADYLALPAVSVSMLKQVADCPAKINVVREQSAAMALGSLVHCAILEPEQLERRYAATYYERSGTKAWDAEASAAGGRELVKIAVWEAALRMRDAVHGNPFARALISGAVTERTLIWQDDDTGLMCRARLDGQSPLGCPFDLKTTVDASPRAFVGRAVPRLQYHMQAAFYLRGCRALGLPSGGFPLIALETAPPHVTMVYPLGSRSIEAGDQLVSAALNRYAELLAIPSEKWPTYAHDQCAEIDIPEWALAAAGNSLTTPCIEDNY